MSNRPVLYTRVSGITYTPGGEMVEIDRLEQGTGAAVFTAYDDGEVNGKVYGEVSAVDVANILFVLRKSVGSWMFDMALDIVEKADKAFRDKGGRDDAVCAG